MVNHVAVGAAQFIALSNVAEAGGRVGWLNAERDDVALLRHVVRRRQRRAKGLSVADVVIRCQDGDGGLRVALLDDGHTESGCRAALLAVRLNDEILQRYFRRFGAHHVHVLRASDHIDALWCEQRREPLHADLEHRAVFDQGKQLFGLVVTAQRPEPRAAAPRHNHRIVVFHVRLFNEPVYTACVRRCAPAL